MQVKSSTLAYCCELSNNIDGSYFFEFVKEIVQQKRFSKFYSSMSF